jgi:sucrose phosphorylase
MFMPGTPQVWYLDLLAGLNDEEALRRIPKPDDREVNRHSYALEEAEAQLSRPIVQKQIELLRMRSGHPAFAMESVITAEQPDMNRLCIERRNGDAWARLEVDVKTASYHIELSGTAY